MNSSQAKAILVIVGFFLMVVGSGIAYGILAGGEHGVTTSVMVGLFVLGVVGVMVGLALFFAFSDLARDAVVEPSQ